MYWGNKSTKYTLGQSVSGPWIKPRTCLIQSKPQLWRSVSITKTVCFIKDTLSVVHAIHYDMGIWLWSCGRNELTDKLFYCALMIFAVSYWRRPRNISEQLAAGPDWAFSNTTTSSREILCSHGNSQWFITLIIKTVSYSETSINT
jgi:hypothetical protein